ncbi:hypothetical protein BGZ49_007748 [Haplosporangium sp. Z 27]|nr:hypothetical protein BGZ49_007748 [Haplosporangium sp. Z 27]
MPENRCQLLEEYVEEVLRPEIEARVISWQREGFTRNCVPAPTKISNVTLSGWLLNFPVTYVLPRSCPKEKEQRRLHHESSDDDEDDNECGRNCLADRELVVTHVQLEPSKGVKGLKDHCLMSFSYPAHLAEFCKHSSNHTTESPCKLKASRRRSYPSYDDDELEDHDDDNDVYVDASDVAYRSRSGSMANSHESINSKSTPTIPSVVGANYKEPDPMFAGDNPSKTNKSSTEYPGDDPYQTQTHSQQTYQPRPQLQANGRSISLSDHIPQQSSNTRVKSGVMEHEPVPVAEYCGRVGSELPLPSNEDVYTAGRSFLQQMHNRFQDQRVWKAWEVGQQNVTLPVVGLR